MRANRSAAWTAAGIFTLIGVTACGQNQTPQTPNPTTAPTSTATTQNTTNNSQSAKTYDLNMKIVTGKMDGKPGWPKFEPADVTLPANTVVHVTIHDYDDGPATIPQGDNKVQGTVGGNITWDGKTVTSVPANNVAHTLTISSIGFNVPIPPKTDQEKYATVSFSFKTPATAQTLDWQCMAACGTGGSGWQGPMETNGWMKGVFTIK